VVDAFREERANQGVSFLEKPSKRLLTEGGLEGGRKGGREGGREEGREGEQGKAVNAEW